MNNGLLIIDGSAMLTTAYYGTLPPEIKFNKNHEDDYLYYGKILNRNGIYTNGIFSFMNRLEKIISECKPSHLAITFDVTRNTFRRKMYPEYKGNRKETPEPLKMQRDLLPKILMEMGIPAFASSDFEGDDIIGSLCERFRSEIPVRILANDHDMMQLVKPNVQLWMTYQSQEKADTVFYDYTQGEAPVTSLKDYHLPDAVFPFGRESIKWDMGVYPEQIPDLKGLSGDSSDNIPGVKGISEKTAALLLSKYGTLENVFTAVKNTDTEELKKLWKEELGFKVSPIKKLLADDAEEKALLSKKLATIVTGLDCKVSLNNLEIHINEEMRKKWYEYLGFKSILDKKPVLAVC